MEFTLRQFVYRYVFEPLYWLLDNKGLSLPKQQSNAKSQHAAAYARG